MRSTILRVLAIGAGLFGLPAAGVVQAPPAPQGAGAAEPAGPASRYVRATDSEDGARRELHISIRTLAPKAGEGPIVHLVGAAHIGEKTYYAGLQEFLDAQSLVLYEGVKPEADAAGLDRDDAARAKITASRQRLLAIMVSKFRRANTVLPESLEAAVDAVGGQVGQVARGAMQDGWGNPQRLVLTLEPDTRRQRFDIVSLGADGAEGGEGANADIRFSTQKPLRKSEVDAAGEGIQMQLARALGMEFQLAAIDYNRPNWRNSDLSIDEVEERLGGGGEGESAEPLFQLLDGSSTMAKMAGMLLGMIERDPQMSSLMRLMMIETLSQAEDLMGSMPGEMDDFMRVIIHDRNEAVLDDLRRVLDREKTHASIALFYGAGHLPDLEKRLVADFGYEFREARWLTGMTVAYDAVPGGKEQAATMREMIRSMMGQMRQGK
ncbi:MAG: type II secretion system protein GspG [Planctomycetota bacterium]|nr:type II secretion system protein GspG [Planctomycetota bacterium]